MPGNVLPGQHVACSYLITSPLTTIAENPFLFREGQYNDAVEFLKWLPTCWDETIVLPQSEIGQFAAFARRNGNTWYIAAATAGPAESAFSLNFLGDGDYRMVLLADDGNYGLRTENREVTRFDTLNISIPPCGGIVAKIEPHI